MEVKNSCVEINVQLQTKCNISAKCFLSNKVNKHSPIYLLASFLQQHNIKLLHAEDGADLLTVGTAVDIAIAVEKEDTVLDGKDNDLLTLLCH